MGSQAYDVLVIGAGIVGSACAYRLACQGLKVGIVESAPAPATGSTGRSAAGARVQFSTEANVRLSWESIKEYESFAELHGTPAVYHPVGYLFLVPEDKWGAHLSAVAMQQAVGAPINVLSPQEASEIIEIDKAGIVGATFGPKDGVVDPHLITMTYLELARRLGASLMVDCEVLSASVRKRVWQLRTRTCVLEAPIVVNAAGPWAGVVGARAGLNIPVQPLRRTVFVSSATPESRGYPLTIDLGSGFYLRSEGPRILMGLSNPDESPGFVEGIDWGWLEPTIEAGLSRFPWLENIALDRRASWSGFYEVTPDNNPIIGAMPGTDGWINACGFSGHGVQQAAAVGRVVAEVVVHGGARTVNIDDFRIERFMHDLALIERHII